MVYFLAIIVMIASVGLVLFGKGVLAARVNEREFNFIFFVQDNIQRLLLAIFGLACVAIVIYLDPLGWSVLVDAIGNYYSETLAGFLRYGSPAVVGLAIGGVTLILPSNGGK